MKMTIITYRTKISGSHNQFAIVPDIWLSDLLHWLVISELATIVSKSDTNDDRPIIPTDWPSYQTCIECIKIGQLVESIR